MLSVKNFHFSYGKKDILKSINIEVNTGEILGILGMNGAGKTTLFKSIYGLLKAENKAISYNDLPIEAEEVSFLETENFFYPYMTGQEYLRLVTTNDGVFHESWNEIFQLPLETYVDTYSTGMKKRLAFWGVLEQKRPIVILDEPFNGVDIESVESFHQIILKLKEKGCIILISSHILATLTRICDSIAYLHEGTFQKIYQPASYHLLKNDLNDIIKKKLVKFEF